MNILFYMTYNDEHTLMYDKGMIMIRVSIKAKTYFSLLSNDDNKNRPFNRHVIILILLII